MMAGVGLGALDPSDLAALDPSGLLVFYFLGIFMVTTTILDYLQEFLY